MCHDWVERPGLPWSYHNGVECTKPRRASERRMTEHRLLDELLQRRMEELEETEGEHELDLLERRLASCAQQAARGKCGKSWMQGRCCRECGGCRSSRRL